MLETILGKRISHMSQLSAQMRKRIARPYSSIWESINIGSLMIQQNFRATTRKKWSLPGRYAIRLTYASDNGLKHRTFSPQQHDKTIGIEKGFCYTTNTPQY